MSRQDLPEVIRVAGFRSALRGFQSRTEAIARSAGLTPQRYLLLLSIKGAPDGSEQATVSDLAERLHLAVNSVTELVQRAEAVGLVQREASERDARVSHLRLTEEGERRLMASFAGLEAERLRLHAAIGVLEAPDNGRR